MLVNYLPFDTLSTKLIIPYTNALDSLFLAMRSATIDKLFIRMPAPPDPRKAATKYISTLVYSLLCLQPEN